MGITGVMNSLFQGKEILKQEINITVLCIRKKWRANCNRFLVTE